ncbi:MAG: helix-turn-helix domain-containing protein [Bosea sp.]|uniref:helix-turn-helix domain-containing protein n=1 Tax=Bosea sp. (in: a-proteobacteria) TaxID=1871050 RepID=UPI001ACF572E|nr:helix-turn-helix domain-containing protein [Bosea sp. (in: a-proteobacteria)]MBN9454932.1 helix-turn-helix domain-containing protein [Bosea sp. (in: a-proteobacteria)]
MTESHVELVATTPRKRIVVSSPSSLMVTMREAAEALSISQTTLYSLISSGKLRSVKVGKSRRIKRAEIEAFMARGEQ